jgi:hypothetical protein
VRWQQFDVLVDFDDRVVNDEHHVSSSDRADCSVADSVE